VQCFADQQFIGVGSVHVSRVDQGHACIDGLSQECDSPVTVGVVAPMIRAGELHCSVADTTDVEVAAKGDEVAEFAGVDHLGSP
jgi:hypothetical protein